MEQAAELLVSVCIKLLFLLAPVFAMTVFPALSRGMERRGLRGVLMRAVPLVPALLLASGLPAPAQLDYSSNLPQICAQGLAAVDPGQALVLLQACEQDPDYELMDDSQQEEVASAIGFALLKLKRYDDALDVFDRLVAVEEALGLSGHAHRNRGVAHRAAGYLDLALADFSTDIAARPSAESFLQRGVTYETLGRPDLALPDYERALALNPEDNRTVNCLAWLLATSPNPNLLDGQRALLLAHDLVSRAPSATHVDTMAAALARNGHFTEAVAAQESALDMARQEGGAGDFLAQLEQRLALYRQNLPYTQD